ncbi:CHASE domain-containing protein [Rubellimicrobium arenae]|uniref:CHASE domain-containing protein n=1 Tax=Rubellimicrobium arenae TaxID=2817372 RepID=UPI001B305460|nr:CHASE domain-containing protein [Rubellimicrobium arenae]
MLRLSRLSLAVATALSLVGAGLTWSVYRTELAGQQSAFDVLVQRAATRVETRIEQHIALLAATRAFLEVHHDPGDRDVFAAFVQSLGLEGRYSGIQGIGLARVVGPQDEAEVQAHLLRDYGVGARIWPEPLPGLRTAIVLLEPDNDRNRAAIGFDMATEERRRAAMIEALQGGEAAATAPLRLVQEISGDVQAGILIYLPLRRSAAPGMEGFAYAPVRIGDLFTAALTGDELPVEIRAADADAPDLPLFVTSGYESADVRGGLSSHARLTVGGREWDLAARPTPRFDTGEPLRHTLLSGIAFALLVLSTSYAVHWQGMAIRRARTLGETVQRNAEQKDLLLREMAHRLKNALTRVSAIARATARETTSKEDLVARLNARLQAMSAAQDLLMLSGTDSADLEELLRSEIDQISGAAANQGHLAGPAVRLDERQTHALALVFHELGTNSLKYGAGAQAGGELRVDWSVEPQASGDELRLTWEERTRQPVPAASGPGSGFGTRLLETLVVGELGGRFARRPQPDGVIIEIHFPLASAVQVLEP